MAPLRLAVALLFVGSRAAFLRPMSVVYRMLGLPRLVQPQVGR
jgi:hypothetical protein